MNFKKILLIVGIFLLLGVGDVKASTLDCSSSLVYGDIGGEVKKLQRILNKVEDCDLEIDGSFGSLTRSCVIKYQKNNNLEQDGMVGPLTCSSLNKKVLSLNNNSGSSNINLGVVSTNSDLITLVSSNLSKGDYGNNVRILQKELNKVMNCGLEVDGSFGNNTYSCLVSFQKKFGISSSGKLNTDTRSYLNNVYRYKQGIVNANNVNLRSGAGTSYKVISMFYKGDSFYILNSKKVGDNTWYYVTDGSIKGYIRADYLSTTFVEVDIDSQVLRLYVNGNLYLDSLITTGRNDGSNDTPKGYYKVTSKLKNITLEKYDSYVNYWIGIDNYGSLGIHDASWRGTKESYTYYGGIIYQNTNNGAGSKYSGSHGCINTPYDKIKKIFSKISVGTPVKVY